MAGDEEPGIEVWPDNWLAVLVFAACGTQWRVGPGGPVGLDYSAIPVVMRLHAVPRADWRDTFDSLRVMEREALDVMQQQIREKQ